MTVNAKFAQHLHLSTKIMDSHGFEGHLQIPLASIFVKKCNQKCPSYPNKHTQRLLAILTWHWLLHTEKKTTKGVFLIVPRRFSLDPWNFHSIRSAATTRELKLMILMGNKAFFTSIDKIDLYVSNGFDFKLSKDFCVSDCWHRWIAVYCNYLSVTRDNFL